MAKVTFNRAIQEIRGSIDHWTFRQLYGRARVSPKREARPRPRSVAEAATNERFRRATQAAKYAPPEMIARYDERARLENKSRFSIRTRDYMTPPRISAVFTGCYTGAAGEPIFVIARDDFEVKEVRVTLRQRDGLVVETGLATRCDADVYRYETTAAAPAHLACDVEVTASDWPGNVSTWRTPAVQRS